MSSTFFDVGEKKFQICKVLSGDAVATEVESGDGDIKRTLC